MRSFGLSRKQPQDDSGEESEPLAKLRRRCAIGWRVTGSAYLAVIVVTVAHPSALTLKQIISLEFGLGIIGMGCVFTAIFVRLLTHNAAYALSLWAMADGARSSGTARGVVPAPLIPPTRSPAPPQFSPIPIERGRQVRQQRAHRAG